MVYFYPRPPRGGRQPIEEVPADGEEFLSTPSARRATRYLTLKSNRLRISIHALREEGDKST